MWKRLKPGRFGLNDTVTEDTASTLGPSREGQDRRDDPLGLLVLHAPPERTIDILFIHGLGGTSLRSWCYERHLDNLWPKLWLPNDLPTARILTFGYNAHFSSRKAQASYTIGDFASDLLFRMRYGEKTPERLGQVPIVIVAHSMGGLVFKKAFIQGHLNDEFRDIISMIKAVVFLATPHQGTDLAGTLNRFLSGSVFGHAPKDYVTELARRSPTIDELNEAFRNHAPKLQIFSFYETLATAMGPISVKIVDRPTAVMGYPNETQTPLNANHHDVCKFSDTSDPNYVAVVGALRSVVDSVISRTGGGDQATSEEDLRLIQDFLGVAAAPEEDLAFGLTARKKETYRTFMESDQVGNWVRSTSSHILWAHAPPGSGKSTISSFVIEHLLEADRHCSYFFFKYGQHRKHSTMNMLHSLAYQTALRLPEYRQALAQLARSGGRVSKDAEIAWKRLFIGCLDDIKPLEHAIYWVIDGLDESESSKQVVELISGIADFNAHVRVAMFSRPLPDIHQAFQLANKRVPVVELPLPDNRDDIRFMVAAEIESLLSGDHFKAEVIREVVTRSQGNFLWASLVTKQVVKCRREDQVMGVLDSTPDGMDQLFDRMMDVITDLGADDDKNLSRILLIWAMYAKSPVTIEELSEIYPAELRSIMDLNHTISQVCGQFVVVNPQGRVTLVHHSAREYLERTIRRPFPLNSEHANEEILIKCLVTLCKKELRQSINALNVPVFLPYASTSWASHLEHCSPGSTRVLGALVRFLNGPSPLVWIQYLAMSGRLSELLVVSAKLTTFVQKRKEGDPVGSPLINPPTEFLLLETWAVDFMRLTAKFGRYLSEEPGLIYKSIPALSPTTSIIHRKFAGNPATVLSVSGLSNEQWDDCLARVSGGTAKAFSLTSSPSHLAIASNELGGTITTWDTKVFREVQRLRPGEGIWSIAFNKSGSLLICYASSQTFVWETRGWLLKFSTSNPRRGRATRAERVIEMKWDEDDDAVFMVSEQRRVYKLQSQHTQKQAWIQLDPALLEEPDLPRGTALGTPSCVKFNADCTQIAVVYGSSPMSIWNVDPPEMAARLSKSHSYTASHHVDWHPSGAVVIGITDGQIFKWCPTEDTYEVKRDTELRAYSIVCSPNGRVFITKGSGGSIGIYDFSSMSRLYVLSSEDMISEIHFGHGDFRFYDLRESYCNVWEPRCLLGLAEGTFEKSSDDDSAADDGFWSSSKDTVSSPTQFAVLETHAGRKSAVRSIQPGQTSRQPIAHTNNDGSLNIYDIVRKKKVEIAKATVNWVSYIDNLAWSKKHDQLAYSMAGAVSVVSVSTADNMDEPLSAETVYAEKELPPDRVWAEQLLFDTTGTRLLVRGEQKCQVLSMPDGVVLAEHQLPERKPWSRVEEAKWQLHPSKPEYILCLTSRSIAVFSWDDLVHKQTIALDPHGAFIDAAHIKNCDSDPEPIITAMASATDTSAIVVGAILDSHNPRLLLLRIETVRFSRFRYNFMVLPTDEMCTPPTTTAPTSIKPLPVHPSLAMAVAHPVGILNDGRLVFLDERLWVCTTRLSFSSGVPPEAPEITRHFFLPQDWVTPKGLRLCRVLLDGTFLCPVKGEVAIMRGDLVSETVRNWYCD
ncbi:hypothetical protein B0H67DRAFT_666819 [Lasiosphaeris hirsuta]|uniref:GPI inositol-deacylase n=1 Tax=Lasiosphaeris hirsuta TaxID=260670 RepID=A0AA40AI15_9PEZI|nr:hypothetical protein B0H67DRAFT_666819 [Lasiosphaeris hirsuta]